MASRRSKRLLDESRRRFEERLERVRRSVDREVGTALPDSSSMTLPLLAFAAGIAAAAGVVSRFRHRRRALEQRRASRD